MRFAQDEDPREYPHAYLVTAARFLGYHFNPVSFWYLYSASKRLEAIVLEVNNTFDERRMYFLARGDVPPERHIAGQDQSGEGDDTLPEAADGAAYENGGVERLTKSFPKDFHVSPFNSRKGTYSLMARDPLAPGMEGQCYIENTVNLVSSKGHPKLVARLFSQGPAIDPKNMTAIQKLSFLLSWLGVGFVTFPRIVKQAAMLYFRRGLHVWYRPEPLKSSIGRQATGAERQLEAVFRLYLRRVVDQANVAVVVKYIPSGISDAKTELMTSPGAKRQPRRAEEMEFKVLTPAFYARFVHYAHDLEAMFCEFRENCTIWISRPDIIPKLLLRKPPPPLRTSNILDFIRFRTIQKLRQRPERIERPLTSSAAATTTTAAGQNPTDIRDFRLSAMDGFVLCLEDSHTRKAYRSVVSSMFVSERIALGSLELLGIQRFALRALVAWALSRSLGMWIIDMVLGA